MLPKFAFAIQIQTHISESHLLSSVTRLHRYLNEFTCFSSVSSIIIVTGTFSLLLVTLKTFIFRLLILTPILLHSYTILFTSLYSFPLLSATVTMAYAYLTLLTFMPPIFNPPHTVISSVSRWVYNETGRATVQSSVSLHFRC